LPSISPGLKGLERPIVWVFPKLLLCLDCGVTEFTVPKSETRVLREGIAPSEPALIAAGSVEILNRQSNADKLSALKKRVHSSEQVACNPCFHNVTPRAQIECFLNHLRR